MFRSRVTLVPFAAIVIIGAALLVLWARNGSPDPTPHAPTAPSELGCGGSTTTLGAAAESMPFPLELPNTAIANAGNIEEVLVCASDQLEVDFTTGVILTLGINHLADPQGEWATLAKDYAEFSTGKVRGVPASLADPEKGALGGVDLVQDGIRITITGNGSIPLNDLVNVTESLQPLVSPTPSPGS